MADVAPNPHNPFRTPGVSPNPTGIAHSTPQYAPPPHPPPATAQYAPPATPHPDSDPTGLTEEAPPAYTTRPDVYQGESTVEFGPARPFQQVPMQQPPPPPPPQNGGWIPQQASAQPPSLWQQLTGQSIGSSTAQFPPASWSSYPGGQQQQQQQQYAPPSPPQQAPPLTTHVSEFARDFYATTNVPPGAFSDVSGARNASASGSEAGYPPPALPPPQQTAQYQPPPGAPPAARTPSPSHAGGGGMPDDGRPTSTPIPGHPFLNNGHMLVYRPHHECSKCNNTGYKHGDPSRPCSKCWSRYARPYSGAVAHAPPASASGSGSAGHASTTFQRPLPRMYAPPRSPAPGSLSAYPGASSSHLSSASTRTRTPSPSPTGLYGPSPATYGPGSAPSPGGYGPGPPPQPPGAYPPPPTVYAPGDARMGGAPCWRCGGRGTLSFLVFETMPCSVCQGVGSVFG
ncbi:hypothetical protein DFH06DRAFT_1375091 [Mycena polygramma]|nr:hypothetical protein DFH06DRAFT_1375091 [Mycena polygramma]